MIYCEFSYCVYNKKRRCLFKTISVSSLGLCEECMVADIDDEILERYKKGVLERLDAKSIKKSTKVKK